MNQRIAALLATISLALTGCASDGEPVLPEEDVEAIKAAQAVDAVAAPNPVPKPAQRTKAEIPPHRRPERLGDNLLYYPVQWRKAEVVREELYPILAQKYGPDVTIVIDQDHNALLIQLPPRVK